MDAEDLILHFERWQSEVRREVERQGRYSRALNSILIVVRKAHGVGSRPDTDPGSQGAFIAGVQGQLLSITLELDPAALKAQACNYIGFVGLIAEVAGTFFGAANAVKLQLKAQRGAQALDRMEGCKGNRSVERGKRGTD
ncbi:hypothetical protein BKA70DRAFT_1301688 [Coprinopsis sp. MPI-PUGE-AT-0042]|nr:hypothetical protein BKA70DRAFT_1301688 [Coprinopsis sp. MPI-PUGE-AT-0042]